MCVRYTARATTNYSLEVFIFNSFSLRFKKTDSCAHLSLHWLFMHANSVCKIVRKHECDLRFDCFSFSFLLRRKHTLISALVSRYCNWHKAHDLFFYYRIIYELIIKLDTENCKCLHKTFMVLYDIINNNKNPPTYAPEGVKTCTYKISLM